MSGFNRFKRPDTYPIGAILEDTMQETRRVADDIDDTDERLDFAQQLEVASERFKLLADEVRGYSAMDASNGAISFRLSPCTMPTVPAGAVEISLDTEGALLGSGLLRGFGERVRRVRADASGLDWGDDSMTDVDFASDTWAG